MSLDTQAQKDAHFKGFVKLWLRDLRFESGCDVESLEVDERKVERLLQSFRDDGCHRRERVHALPVVLDSSTLTGARADGPHHQKLVFSQTVYDAPLLRLPHDEGVVCLDGNLRVRAAREFLAPCDQWWTAEVYDSGKSRI